MAFASAFSALSHSSFSPRAFLGRVESHSTNYLSLLLNSIEETFLQHVFRNLVLLLLHIQCLHFQGLCRINLRNGQYSHANNIL